MPHILVVIVTLSLVASSTVAQGDPVPQKANEAAPDRWELVWSDEFDGKRNASPDKKKWLLETGGHGWGNNELQTYTDRRRNVRHDGKGHLVIEIRKEKYKGKDGKRRSYTSARLKTQGKFSQAYGRFEARIKLPTGKGVWSAFWMLGDDIGEKGWPRCGEIDIMENLGHEAKSIHGTLHGPGYSAQQSIGKKHDLETKFHEDFHVFTVEWDEDSVEWFVDGKRFQKRTKADLKGKEWVYDHPHFLLFNVAVGGHWPGSPDSSTRFPQRMLIDWVRVYRRATKVDGK